MDRFVWLRRIAALDPAHPTEAEEIHKITAGIEFPWDVRQALGLALFRTYAVPSVGELLARTGEFTAHTQKRYDDTVLLLGATVDRGFDDPGSRTAIRRMNQMHRRYGIGNDDMLYVLSTFVVTPLRWLDEFGWRRLHPHERRAAVTHYRALGRRMGIRDMPEDEAGFAALMDGVEAERFAHTAGGREVADATLALLATFPPSRCSRPHSSVGPPRASWTRTCCARCTTPCRRGRSAPRPGPACGCGPRSSAACPRARRRSPSTTCPRCAPTRTASTSPAWARSRRRSDRRPPREVHPVGEVLGRRAQPHLAALVAVGHRETLAGARAPGRRRLGRPQTSANS